MTTKRRPDRAQSSVKVGAELEIDFTDLLANGQAVGRTSDVVVFCFGPLPRERAHIRITSVKPKYVVGEMLELLVESPERVEPFCAVFGACGGCQVQHLAYPAQLAWKRDVVRNALARIGGFAGCDVREPIGMARPRDYRNKMSLVVDHRSALPVIGFYRQRSHDVVAIDACPIVMPNLSDYIARLNDARLQAETAPALAQARHIVARSALSTGRSVVTITTSALSKEAKNAAPALLARLPGAIGVTNSYDLTGANAIVGRSHRLLAGDAEITEEIDGVRYRVSARSFFQVNAEIVSRIFAFMRPGLAQAPGIVDLYCGAGTFAVFFAKHGSRVMGVEENEQAVAEARGNSALNGVGPLVRFHTGRVEEAVGSPEVRAALAKAYVVFLDPPRKGSDETTLDAIAAAGVSNVWYLSCDPATLARDLKYLAAKGYLVSVVQPFDMFPQTGHVETLVTLHREGAPPLLTASGTNV